MSWQFLLKQQRLFLPFLVSLTSVRFSPAENNRISQKLFQKPVLKITTLPAIASAKSFEKQLAAIFSLFLADLLAVQPFWSIGVTYILPIGRFPVSTKHHLSEQSRPMLKKRNEKMFLSELGCCDSRQRPLCFSSRTTNLFI